MIHYALRCADAHEFDGWFRSSASFDAQAAEGLLVCPACGSSAVTRAVMAPRIALGNAVIPRGQGQDAGSADQGGAPAAAGDPVAHATATSSPSGPAAVAPSPPSPGPPVGMPDQMRAVLQRIRAEVEKSCAYVGPDFAREVRRMAETGAKHRPIYGEASDEDAAALAEDGIAVARIPWVPRADG